MASATAYLTGQIVALMAEYDRAKVGVDAKVRYMPEDVRPEERLAYMQSLDGQYRAALDELADRLWSWPNGVAWAEAERAAKALRQARADAADAQPWQRVALERDRVAGVVAAAFSLADLRDWYDHKADTTERLALAYNAGAVSGRFGLTEPGVGEFVRQLEADREALFSTDTVKRLAVELQARLDERYPAYMALKNAVNRTGVDVFALTVARRLLREIDPNYRVEPSTGEQTFEFEHIDGAFAGVGESVPQSAGA